MCGIIGYVGVRTAQPVLLEGLRRLEYRGYDSAGIATLSGSRLHVRKRAGRLANLAVKLFGEYGLQLVLVGFGEKRHDDNLPILSVRRAGAA